jgi:hypothetical protein
MVNASYVSRFENAAVGFEPLDRSGKDLLALHDARLTKSVQRARVHVNMKRIISVRVS